MRLESVLRFGAPLLAAVWLLIGTGECRAQFLIPRSVVGNGAFTASNGSHRIRATLGLASIGHTGSQSHLLCSGYWCAGLGRTSGVEPGVTKSPPSFTSVSPNPASNGARLFIQIPASGVVDLGIFDSNGRKIRSIVSGEPLQSGSHSWNWDLRNERGRPVAAGVYFGCLGVDGRYVGSQRITVLH